MPPAVLVVLAAAIGLTGWLFRPQRYEVEGLSMAPALLPGDIVSSGWLPQTHRLTGPHRFDRWIVTAPDGRPAIKRIAGLPGEMVALIDGDVAIDGSVVLTPPRVLAEVASPIAECAAVDAPWQRLFAAGIVYDDAPFAPEETRLLLPVHDIGLAAVIDAAATAFEAVVRVGDRAVRWKLSTPARCALVAGRVDGHLVAAAWLLPAGAEVASGRSALPPQPPLAWQIHEPWSETATLGADALPPLLGLRLARDGAPLDGSECDRLIVRCTAWRDILHRPPADGTSEWRLGPREVFVLGDFPSGSRDSRHWGPLPAAALQHQAPHVSRTRPGPDGQLP